MDEQKWLTTTDLGEMLRYLEYELVPAVDVDDNPTQLYGYPVLWTHYRDKPLISDRKLRLFACNYVRTLPIKDWQKSEQFTVQKILEVAEEFADDLLTSRDEMRSLAYKTFHAYQGKLLIDCRYEPPTIHSDVPNSRVVDIVNCTCFTNGARDLLAGKVEPDDPRLVIFRDLVGNPFRLIKIDNKPPKMIVLAQRMYDERDFSLIPILGDMLLDTGCEDQQVLDHCREERHWKGCWLIDAILGKE